jgi:hypothetical protein
VRNDPGLIQVPEIASLMAGEEYVRLRRETEQDNKLAALYLELELQDAYGGKGFGARTGPRDGGDRKGLAKSTSDHLHWLEACRDRIEKPCSWNDVLEDIYADRALGKHAVYFQDASKEDRDLLVKAILAGPEGGSASLEAIAKRMTAEMKRAKPGTVERAVERDTARRKKRS